MGILELAAAVIDEGKHSYHNGNPDEQADERRNFNHIVEKYEKHGEIDPWWDILGLKPTRQAVRRYLASDVWLSGNSSGGGVGSNFHLINIDTEIEYKGELYTVRDLAKITGLSTKCIKERYASWQRGTIEYDQIFRAKYQPITVEYEGRVIPLKELAKKLGFAYNTVFVRYQDWQKGKITFAEMCSPKQRKSNPVPMDKRKTFKK